MIYYIDEQGLLEKEEKLCVGLIGFEDLIKELDEMRESYANVQDRFEQDLNIYHQDLKDMLDHLVEFNQSFKRTYEALVGKIK